MRGAVFNLASATLGAGALSLPYAFAKSGILLGLLWLAIASGATVFSIKLLLRASHEATRLHGGRIDTYEDLAATVFGHTMQRVVEAAIILFCYGTAIAYCVAVGDILKPIRSLDAFPDAFHGHSGRTLVMVLFWAIFMLPLSLLRSVNSLQFSSFLGVSAIAFLVVATIYHCTRNRFIDDWDCTEMYNDSSNLDGSDCTGGIKYANPSIDIITSLPLVMFAFTCQVNVYDIYRELKKPSEELMMKVSWIGMAGLCFTVYAAMGIFGYLDFRGAVAGNILRNFEYDTKHDAVIVIAFVCITLTVVVAFPLVVFPCREAIYSVLHAPRTDAERDEVITQYSQPDKYPNVQKNYVVGSSARPKLVRSHSDLADDSSGAMSPQNRSPRSSLLGSAVPTPAEYGGPRPRRSSTTGSRLFLPPEAYFVPPKTSRVYRRPPAWRHFLVSFAISASALLFALLIPDIQVVFSFLGGVCSSFLCFVLPAWFVKRLELNTEEHLGRLGVIGTELLFWGGALAGLLSTGVTFYNTFSS